MRVKLHSKDISLKEFIHGNEVYFAGANLFAFIHYDPDNKLNYRLKSYPDRGEHKIIANGKMVITALTDSCYLLVVQNYEFYRSYESGIHNHLVLRVIDDETLIKVAYPVNPLDCKE